MDKNLIEKLNDIGVAIHSSRGLRCNPLAMMLDKHPVCAIWCESENPTKNERIILKRIVEKLIGEFEPNMKNGFMAEPANTVVLKKQKSKWSFRRLIWPAGLWSPSGSLAIVEQEIYKRGD